jgi:integrase
LRGVVFEATDKLDALRTHRELLKLAQEAVAAGAVAKFLDALDKRAGTRPDQGPTFSQFAEDWYQTCVKGSDLRESQQLSDEQILRLHLKPFFGRHHLGEIGGRMIDRYKAEKRTEKHHRGVGYSSSSMNNHLSVLHRVFEKAVEYRLVEKNPIHKSAWMSSDRTPEDMENWWTPADEEKAFTFLHAHWREEHPRRYMPLLLQLVVGMRFSELRALEKRDLDFTTPGLWIRRAQARKKVSTPKNKHARFHVIPRALAEELKAWMLRTEGQLLFPALHGGPITNNVLNHWYDELCRLSGVRKITSHGARHTSGSSYAVMGAGQKMIARLLGHANTSATERYTHVQADATTVLVEARWARLAAPPRT